MTVSDLRVLVDNLEEYIHVPGGIERLKKTILHLAVSGKLVPQDPSEGTGEELYQQILSEKAKLIAEGKLKKQKPLAGLMADEIPFDIPSSWKWSRLSNVSLVVTDGDHQPPPQVSQGVPFLVIGDVRSGKLDTNLASRKVSQQYYDKLDWAHQPIQGDLLYTTVGSYGIPVPVVHDEPFCFQRHIGLVRPGTRALSNYMLCYLKSSFAFDQATAYATGIAQKTVPVLGMRNFLIPLPSGNEQKRIVEKVNSIFTLIDELAVKYVAEQREREKLVGSSLANLAKGQGDLALNHLAEIIRTKSDAAQIRKTILHLAVSGQLVPQDPSEGTGEQLFTKIQAEKAKLIAAGKLKKQKPLPEITPSEIPFQIPKTWKWTRLGELGDFGSGSTPPRGEDKYYGGEINWYKSGELTDSYMFEASEEKVRPLALKECSLRLNQPGDILLAMYGATAGKLGLLETVGATNQAVCGFTPIEGIDRMFMFNSLHATRKSLLEQSAGAAQPNISKVKIVNHYFALPPLAEQIRIVQKTTQLLELVAILDLLLEND